MGHVEKISGWCKSQMVKIVAIMPIKLKNERLPGKNTKRLGNKPLLLYELETLLQIKEIDSINVYCSSAEICKYLPEGVRFIERPVFLDLPEANFTQIFKEFMREVIADVYVYAHATAPFISVHTVKECILAVVSGKYDSAFCAERIQDFLWLDGEPLNFDACNVPRSQDLKPIYRETSGVYVFRKEVFTQYGRRVGKRPFVKEVSFREAVDINNLEDFRLAQIILQAERNKYT